MDLNKMKIYGIGVGYNGFHTDVIVPLKEQQAELESKIHSQIGFRNLSVASEIKRGLYVSGYLISNTEISEFKARKNEAEIYNDIYKYKLNSAYLTQYDVNIRRHLDSESRIHPTFFRDCTSTGRLKAINPAAMAFDKKFMKYLMPKPAHSLLHLDYKAMEFRVIAALSNDAGMQKKFMDRSFDMHKENASIVYNKPVNQITDSERKVAKTLGFAILYGMSAQTLAVQLSKNLRKSVSVIAAQKMIDDFYWNYPGVNLYHKQLQRKDSNCQTLKGRKFDGNLRFSQKLNYPVQGTAADAFIYVIDCIEKAFPECQICLPVHDALFVEVPKIGAQQTLSDIKDVMEEEMSRYLGVVSYVDAEIYS